MALLMLVARPRPERLAAAPLVVEPQQAAQCRP
jgi:hypothetical protein